MIKIILIFFLISLFAFVSNNSLALAQSSGDFYDVSRDGISDDLPLGIKAGSNSAVITHIPNNAHFLYVTGREEIIGKDVWVEVQYGHFIGWTTKHDLVPSKTQEFTLLSCLGTEPFWSLEIRSGIIILRDLDESETAFALSRVAASSNHTNRWMLEGTVQGRSKLAIALWKTDSCSDDMSVPSSGQPQ